MKLILLTLLYVVPARQIPHVSNQTPQVSNQQAQVSNQTPQTSNQQRQVSNQQSQLSNQVVLTSGAGIVIEILDDHTNTEVISDAIPEEMGLAPIVSTTTIVEPTGPECMYSLEDLDDPNFVAGDDCSLATQLGVEPL